MASVSILGPLCIQGHTIIHIRAQLFIRHSIRHCAYIFHSIFAMSVRKVLLIVPFSSRSSSSIEKLSNLHKVIATELQKLDLTSYKL